VGIFLSIERERENVVEMLLGFDLTQKIISSGGICVYSNKHSVPVSLFYPRDVIVVGL
jgi:hypothetical protein